MNIILISCDTLRADHLGCYGYSLDTSPFLDSLAKDGVLFENMFGADIPTEPVHTAVFTGQLGLRTGIVAHGAHPAYLEKQAPWLPTQLWEAGYTTAACDNLYILKEWFARGFRHYVNTRSRRRWIDGRDVNEDALTWLAQYGKGEQPFFLFLHYWDTHTPYIVPESYQKLFYDGDPFAPHHKGMEPVRAQTIYPFFHEFHYKHLGPVTDSKYINALYDAEVRYLDDRLSELYAGLEKLGLVDDTLLIIMGDHGESLDEHDIYWDHAGLYEATIKVPLIMHWPKGIGRGRRVSGLVQHVDLLPTIMAAAGLTPKGETSGHSLWGMIRGEEEKVRDRTYHAECNWQASRAVRTSEWKLIHNIDPWAYDRPEYELYHLATDPHEKVNLADEKPELVAELRSDLYQWVESQLDGREDPIQATLRTVGMPAEPRLDRALARWGLTWQEWIKNPDLKRLGI